MNEDIPVGVITDNDLETSVKETQNSSAMERLLTSKQVSSLLNVSPRTLANYKAKGLIPFYQLGRVVRYRYSDVIAHINGYTVKEGGLR
jgi:excisionase family DNA binding protein